MDSRVGMNAKTESRRIAGNDYIASSGEEVSLLNKPREGTEPLEEKKRNWCGFVFRKNYLSLNSDEMKMDSEKKLRSPARRFAINQTMLPYKMFYFLSDGASSCIAPYRSLYLKQLGLGPSRIGVVAAMKPLATFLSNAMIGFLADRYGWRKAIMLTSLLIWIGSLLALGFLPPASEVSRSVAVDQLKDMISQFNHTDLTEEELLLRGVRSNEDRLQTHKELQLRFNERMHRLRCLVMNCTSDMMPEGSLPHHGKDFRLAKKMFDPSRSRHVGHHIHVSSTESPLSTTKSQRTNHLEISLGMDIIDNIDASKNLSEENSLVHDALGGDESFTEFPLTSNMIIELSSDRSWLFDQRELFRLFLIILVITNIIYISLGSFMRLADTATLSALANDPMSEVSDYGWHRSFGGLGWAICSLVVGVLLSGTSVPVIRWGVTLIITNYRVAFLAFALVASLSAVCSCFMDFEYTTCDWETQWSELRHVLLSPHFASVFFVAFFTGVCNGSVWGFLLWHFQNIGASQTLIGVLEAIQSIAELILGYFSRRFLNYLGYINALTLGLGVYGIRFVCYAAISNPLWLIPVEILHGISFLLTWTTLVSYLGTAVPAECMTTVQGILGALYFGLGVGAGSLASGIIIDHFNAVKAFYGFAVASLAVMFLFMVSQQLFPRGSKFDSKTGYDDNGNDEEKQKLDYTPDDEIEEVVTPAPAYPVPIKKYLQPIRTKNEQYLLSPGAGTCPIPEMMPHSRFLRPINFDGAHQGLNQIQQRPMSYCGTATSEMKNAQHCRALPVPVTVSLQQLKQLTLLHSKEKTLPNNTNNKEETGNYVTCKHETMENNWLLPRQRTYTIN